MKRFLLFFGDYYYANGGWNDFQGSFDSIENARTHVATLSPDVSGNWAHIVDVESMTIVMTARINDTIDNVTIWSAVKYPAAPLIEGFS